MAQQNNKTEGSIVIHPQIKTENKERFVSIWLPRDLTKELDALADKVNLSRRDLVHYLLRTSLDLVIVPEE